jgi:hypothetical protein
MFATSYLLAAWSDTTKIMAVGGALIAIFFACGLLVKWLRKKYLAGPGRGPGTDKGFDILELESMLADGRISRDEFRLLRRVALGLEERPGKVDNSTSSTPPGNDDVKEVAPEVPEGP